MTKSIIKKSDIDAMEGLDKAHFLNADAVRNNKSLGDMTGLSGFGFHIIEIQPNKWSTEFHRHYFEDECVYVLDGTATAYLGEQQHDIGPGDFIGYPKGGPAHTIHNSGNTPFRCIVVGERLPQDVADYPNKSKRIFRNKGLEWDLVDLNAIEHPTGGKKV
ncbi:MAG: cupin domain-containing protein [Gammaproteobacteria bacterium]|nr:cupin domain-containing protein [Gammaproteobacteria bacterium]